MEAGSGAEVGAEVGDGSEAEVGRKWGSGAEVRQEAGMKRCGSAV